MQMHGYYLYDISLFKNHFVHLTEPEETSPSPTTCSCAATSVPVAVTNTPSPPFYKSENKSNPSETATSATPAIPESQPPNPLCTMVAVQGPDFPYSTILIAAAISAVSMFILIVAIMCVCLCYYRRKLAKLRGAKQGTQNTMLSFPSLCC